jgi:Phosphotransferase enzyme family
MFSTGEARPLLAEAAEHFDCRVPPGADLVEGLGRRTFGVRVEATADGSPAWLRLLSAPVPGGKLWTGLIEADSALPPGVPRPHLLASREIKTGDRVTRADLLTFVTAPVASPTPDLPKDGIGDLPESWWNGLRDAVASIAATTAPPGREPVISPAYVERTVPGYLAVHLDAHPEGWRLAHGDLHWANLTAPPLTILDWEGFGPAPAGFDAAYLLAHTLPHPPTARRIATVFEPELSGATGRLARLVVAAMILQAADRDALHARLAPLVRAHVADLL